MDHNLSLEQFQKDVAEHSLKIVHDDGLHRHLTVSREKTFNMGYHVTTWPGYLCISGDMGCFVFSRLSDMFQFHRGDFKISFGYWAEKLQAGEAYQFSKKYFRDLILELYEEWEKPDLSERLWRTSVQEFVDAVDECCARWQALELLEEFCEACGHKNHDTCDYELKEYTFRFLWACYAIVHAINLYDEATKAMNDLAVSVAEEMASGR